MTHARKLFDDGKGVVIWIAWTAGTDYEVGPTEEMARTRLTDKVDWRKLALSLIQHKPINVDMRWLEAQILEDRRR